MLRALVGVRWLAWAWMVAIVVFDPDIVHPVTAWLAVIATLLVVVAATIGVRSRPTVLIEPRFVAIDLALAFGLSILDGYVFAPGHVFATTQSLATQWPLIAIANTAVAFGPAIAAVAGVAMGPAEGLGALANRHPYFGVREIVSLVATSLYFAAIGVVVGWLARQLHRVETEIADRRARDEVARVLHDTVLQTLALVARRSATSDPALAESARAADRDLRAFLFRGSASTGEDLATRVRAAVERSQRGRPTPVTVNVLDDGCVVSSEGQETIARAVGEAVNNALEHSAANSIVVFVETDDVGQVYASVHDDGVGFDATADVSGVGIRESIVARMRSIGGDATVTSQPGHGTEVEIWSSR